MSAPAPPAERNIVVAGDVFVDHHLYEGRRDAPSQDDRPALRDLSEPGGAALMEKLLKDVFYQLDWSPGLEHLGIAEPPKEKWCVHQFFDQDGDRHAYAYWSPCPRSNSDKDRQDPARFWRVERSMGYGAPAVPGAASPSTAPPKLKPDIIVLDDAGIGFRHHRGSWFLPENPDDPWPDWILLKLSRPVAQGDLWHALVPRFAKRLVCVVSVDELRQECVSISRGLSWERTVEEVRDALQKTPEAAALTQCEHLIVRFAADGALWVDYTNRSEPKAQLVFDAGGIEGGWDEKREGTVVGSSTTFAAAVVHGLAQSKSKPPLLDAIKSGLAAVRDLAELGHGAHGKAAPNGFPSQRLADIIRKPSTGFGDAVVSWPKQGEVLTPEPGVWMIAEEHQKSHGREPRRPLMDLARQVVIHGVSALGAYPHAQFGALVVIDRLEIELLRSVRRLMIGYKNVAKAEKPLSIGVFGPPGAGKSFGVKQLAKEIFGGQAWLEFNLSQFNDPTDLVGAFHKVRDEVLSGVTPVVFWDEFDSRELSWLQYLLAPMQDGRFQSGPLNHWIGKCVFVFAGGTSARYEDFPPPGRDKPFPAPDEVLMAFKLRKGPDFHSRLDGYYNVVGPNPRALPVAEKWSANPVLRPDPGDVCFPLRRALLIRSKLKCEPKERLDFDSDLLDALLLTPKFEHGARSLEKLIGGLRASGYGSIRRSELLAAPLRGMHVNESFDDAVNRNSKFFMSETIDKLAETIHEMWLAEGKSGSPFYKPYKELAPIDQEDNRAAARRIPRILSLVGLGVVDADSKEAVSQDEATAFLKADARIKRLAEAEHDGWMAQRLANGWRFGRPRDDDKKLHDCLIPYSELKKEEKERDQNKVASFPAMIEKAGYRLAWQRPDNPENPMPS